MEDVHNKLKKTFIGSAGGEPITRLEFDAKMKLKAYQEDLTALKKTKADDSVLVENTAKVEELRSLTSQALLILYDYLDNYPGSGLNFHKQLREVTSDTSCKLKMMYNRLSKDHGTEPKTAVRETSTSELRHSRNSSGNLKNLGAPEKIVLTRPSSFARIKQVRATTAKDRDSIADVRSLTRTTRN